MPYIPIESGNIDECKPTAEQEKELIGRLTDAYYTG